MMLERVKVELEDGRRWFQDSSLTSLMNDPEGHVVERSLFDALMLGLDFQMKTVQSHVGVMAKGFSEHLQVRNMALMYRLQWAILFLSIVSIILAAAGTVSNWDQVERFWQKNVRREATQPQPASASGARVPASAPTR